MSLPVFPTVGRGGWRYLYPSSHTYFQDGVNDITRQRHGKPNVADVCKTVVD